MKDAAERHEGGRRYPKRLVWFFETNVGFASRGSVCSIRLVVGVLSFGPTV